MKILFTVAEASPLAKVGGLADVAGSLPRALRQRGHDVRLIMPYYPGVERAKLQITHLVDSLSVPMMGHSKAASVEFATVNDTPVYFVANDEYFKRPNVYGEPDDLERFTCFSKAVPAALVRIGWRPDVIHCHDWHTGGVVALLKTDPELKALFPHTAVVFTIHNLAYQGWFDDYFLMMAGIKYILPDNVDPALRAKLYSLMALGIYHADVVSTVSPTYAKEILTPGYGDGLEEVLNLRRDDLYGIVNGIDVGEFNPATDHAIPFAYDKEHLDKKGQNKAALQRKLGLPVASDIPVFGMVGRLAEQKGVDILVPALRAFLGRHKAQFALLGSGEASYVKVLTDLAARHPQKMAAAFAFDLELAQLIYAGSDLFVMPSRYEPCGLGQLIALRYGTIPVVRRTGGLADTVQDASPDLETGNGFVFDDYTPEALQKAVQRAVTAFRSKKGAWQRMIERGMSADYSWQASAAEYEVLYSRALQKVS